MASFSYEDTFAKVADIIAEKLGIDKKTITAASTMHDLGADSLDLVEVVMKLEDAFGIEIADEAAEKMANVGELITYIQHKRTK